MHAPFGHSHSSDGQPKVLLITINKPYNSNHNIDGSKIFANVDINREGWPLLRYIISVTNSHQRESTSAV